MLESGEVRSYPSSDRSLAPAGAGAGKVREWAAAERTHAGVIHVYRIDHREFATWSRAWQRRLRLARPWSSAPALLAAVWSRCPRRDAPRRGASVCGSALRGTAAA